MISSETSSLGGHLTSELLRACEIGNGLVGALSILLADEQRGDSLACPRRQLDRNVAFDLIKRHQHLPLPGPQPRERLWREAVKSREKWVRRGAGSHEMRLPADRGVGRRVLVTGAVRGRNA
jgi:hypothetical protein